MRYLDCLTSVWPFSMGISQFAFFCCCCSSSSVISYSDGGTLHLLISIYLLTGVDWPSASSGDSRGPVRGSRGAANSTMKYNTFWALWRILNFENRTRISEVRTSNCFCWILNLWSVQWAQFGGGRGDQGSCFSNPPNPHFLCRWRNREVCAHALFWQGESQATGPNFLQSLRPLKSPQALWFNGR